MTQSLWLDAMPLLLASTSPTRRAMLERVGIPVDVEASGVDERGIGEEARKTGADAAYVARLLAREKARAVSRRHPARLVLAADQTLICDGLMFHKPADPRGAEEQIAALAGRTHELHSAAALVRAGDILAETDGSAQLTMRALEPAFIARYIAMLGPAATASVGAYQVEGPGIHLFERIAGDHFTILGLPLMSVLAMLRAQGCLAG